MSMSILEWEERGLSISGKIKKPVDSEDIINIEKMLKSRIIKVEKFDNKDIQDNGVTRQKDPRIFFDIAFNGSIVGSIFADNVVDHNGHLYIFKDRQVVAEFGSKWYKKYDAKPTIGSIVIYLN